MKFLYAISLLLIVVSYNLKAQCPAGQVEVMVTIYTDDYGYEGYWQLVPHGNACGTGTIFQGGNMSVGCNGGGAQVVTSGGYASMTGIMEGPWCLTQGDSYDIIYVDDYGDGGWSFTVSFNGLPVYSGLTGNGNDPGSRITFVAEPAPALDLSCNKITVPTYVSPGNVTVSGNIFNSGSDTIYSMNLNYTIDNGSVYTSSLSGLQIAPFTALPVNHPISWNPSSSGTYTLKMWATNMNGGTDMNHPNDTAIKIIYVGPAMPNIIDDYINATPVLTVIGNASDGIAAPRDLDFHPILTRSELWVVLESTENSGGKTVKFSNAGQAGQTSLLQQDGNAWHFMSLPTGIAFSDNENFSTSPGVYDANHDGGSPFTGPTLWSSDPAIYAQPSGGNGSHIDMLHQSPYSMGICNESENAFWVFDGNTNDIVRYDFVNPHQPGGSDHSDGIIRRFTGLGLLADATHHVPSHLILDKENGMLYIVDTGNDRVLKMDIHSGTFTSNLTPYEMVAEYSSWQSATISTFINSGLTTPSGIDLIGDRLIVSDYATGDIVIYDKSGATGVELGRIVTGTPGIMGIKIGPDGKIWYVNYDLNEVIRIDGIIAGLNSTIVKPAMSLSPNPATNIISISSNVGFGESTISIFETTGKLIKQIPSSPEKSLSVNIHDLPVGVYFVQVRSKDAVLTKKFIKE